MINLIKEKIKTARLTSNSTELQLLTTLLGEMELESVRKKRDLKTDELEGIVKRFIKSNNETISYLDDVSKSLFERENELLQSFLPKVLCEEEIEKLVIDRNILGIIMEKPEGQAIGLVMKEIKSANLSADGLTVKNYINRIKNVK